ncbi:hypothetical protein JY651_46385 [Pyxidicoccus parkwayensis]|uniref:Lipoprotein n=1 Tax=Pyxidicoccus parkwayensis TaxID=2813578 RepID=A0ABX7NUB4_9BACT|nr:hypothetical protein [Pyxidicoccus parkwaysis]QSQ22469.1 hypothetical protein JY651_46385 [Pyxidicoccus parkwaysis]
MKRRLALLAAVGLLLGASGCAITRDARKELLEGTSSHAVYKLPPDKLLEATRSLLEEQGYRLLPSADSNYVHTTWKINGPEEMGAHWTRILVHAIPLTNGRTMIRAYRMDYITNGLAPSHPGSFAGTKEGKEAGSEGGGTASNAGTSGQAGSYVMGEPLSPTKPHLFRASDFEWALLARVAPNMATFLEHRVDAYLAEQRNPPARADEEEGVHELPEGAPDVPLPTHPSSGETHPSQQPVAQAS